jgi:hypothetical protein
MLALLLAAAMAQDPAPAPEADAPPLIVHLADGSSLPLAGWTLTYEFVAWPNGGMPEEGIVGQRETPDLWIGKRRVPTAGTTLEIVRTGGAAPRLAVLADGKRSEYKAEAPARDLLRVERGQTLIARSLDLHGRTLTGTRRDFCLLSFSATVACGTEPAHVVTRIEFP